MNTDAWIIKNFVWPWVQIVELIKKHNWADIKLYELAKEIFEKQLELMPSSFGKDLEDFEKLMSKKKRYHNPSLIFMIFI